MDVMLWVSVVTAVKDNISPVIAVLFGVTGS
jgi:hypothetical protein